MNRRTFLVGLLCAPAIVRASSLMPVKSLEPVGLVTFPHRIWKPDEITCEAMQAMLNAARDTLMVPPMWVDDEPWYVVVSQ